MMSFGIKAQVTQTASGTEKIPVFTCGIESFSITPALIIIITYVLLILPKINRVNLKINHSQRKRNCFTGKILF